MLEVLLRQLLREGVRDEVRRDIEDWLWTLAWHQIAAVRGGHRHSQRLTNITCRHAVVRPSMRFK